MGLKEAEEGQETLFLSLGLAGAQQFGSGKWVPTSELAPLVPLVGSSSFAENSIIMIAYDVNDALRQQLFPSERARGGWPLRVPTVSSRSVHADRATAGRRRAERIGRCVIRFDGPF